MENSSEQNRQSTPDSSSERPSVIPIIEEQIRIEKQVVETGRVVLTKKVNEQEVTVNVPAMQEEVHVERVAINEYVETPPPAVRYEGDTMIIPVLREEVVVQKRLVLVEELHVTRRQVLTHTPAPVTLRREEVTVERIANESNPSPSQDKH